MDVISLDTTTYSSDHVADAYKLYSEMICFSGKPVYILYIDNILL